MNTSDLMRTCSRISPLLLLLAAGCTSVPDDLGRSGVHDLLTTRGLSIDAVDKTEMVGFVATLTAEPLTPANTARIALLNSPDVRTLYAELGFVAADLYEGGRISNPVFSALIQDSSVSGSLNQNTFGLATSLTDLLTLPARKHLAQAEFAAAKQEIGAAIMQTAVDAEIAYYRFVAAKQVSILRSRIADAGGLSERLAERYSEAGNLTPRDLALARAGSSNAKVAALQAAAEAYDARRDLANLLGLPVDGDWDAPPQLLAPLPTEEELASLLSLSQQSRLDIAAATAYAKTTASRLGLTQWTRWLGEFEIGVETERETDGSRLTGPSVSWQVPIFNQNHDQILRADAAMQVALVDLERRILTADNDVRLAYAAMMNTRSRFEEMRDNLIPQRIAATARAQEEQNFMLIGIFEVLATKQDEYDAYQLYLETVRDYWIARSELSRAVGSRLPGAPAGEGNLLDVEEYTKPVASSSHAGHGAMTGMDHEAMSGMNHGNMTDDTAPGAMDGMEHSGHTMNEDSSEPASKDEPHDMGTMDHSGHGTMPATPPEMDHSNHGTQPLTPTTPPEESDKTTEPETRSDQHGGHGTHGGTL